MATYYVYSGAAGANNGSSWTDAYVAFASAVTAANASGDVIKVHKTHNESLAANTTYTFQNHVAVICVDKDASDALATMDGTNYSIGTNGNYALAVTGAYNTYFYGMAFKANGSGVSQTLTINSTDNGHATFDTCKIWNVISGSGPAIAFGSDSTANMYVCLVNCDVRFGAAGSGVNVFLRLDIYGGQINSAGSAPTTLFKSAMRGANVYIEGMDLSLVTGTLVASMATSQCEFNFTSCKLGAGVTIQAAQTPANRGSAETFLYNCHSGDTHYAFGHYDGLGSTIIETGIYVNDGASPDGGTTRMSWKIVTTSAASFYTPYRSPWFDKYHSGTSAITPYFEILRDGSATAFNDDEVWGEFSIQATTGSVLPVFKDDHMTPLGTPAAQTNSSKTASDWTGENATAWFGKIAAPSATTPAEVGYLRARCVVGKASTTVYLDPTIRT